MLVAIRADASTALGGGHVVRCAALARALQHCGARCVLLCADEAGHAIDSLLAQGLAVLRLPATPRPPGAAPWALDTAADAAHSLAALRTLDARPEWLVVDHYGIDAAWQDLVRPAVGRLLVIDDLADRPHRADTLVDPGLSAAPQRYQAWLPAACKRLLGPRFALLRPDFAAAAAAAAATSNSTSDAAATASVAATGAARPTADAAPRLLACMGASDPHNALGTVLDAWQQLPAPRPPLDIAVGAASPHLARLRARCTGLPGVNLQVQVQAPDMAALMARASLLIGSAGGISWERCAMGLPAISGTVAANQRANLDALTRQRTGLSVGDWSRVDPSALARLLQRLLQRPALQARMARRARRLVDGQGALRVALHLAADHLTLRAATTDDAEAAWLWRNAEATRRQSFDTRALPWDEHLAWWSASLRHPARSLLVAQVGRQAVGVLRLDRAASDATVSVYLDPRFTGLGLGPPLLRAGQRWATEHLPGCALRAEIRPDNHVSIRSFEAAGYQRRPDHWRWDAHATAPSGPQP